MRLIDQVSLCPVCMCRKRGDGSGLSVRSAVGGSVGCLSSRLIARLTPQRAPLWTRCARRLHPAATPWLCAAHSAGRGSPQQPGSTVTSGPSTEPAGAGRVTWSSLGTGAGSPGPKLQGGTYRSEPEVMNKSLKVALLKSFPQQTTQMVRRHCWGGGGIQLTRNNAFTLEENRRWTSCQPESLSFHSRPNVTLF